VEDYTNKGMSVTTELVGDIQASLANSDLISEEALARWDFLFQSRFFMIIFVSIKRLYQP
jgi:hypothetical protein